MALCVKYIFYKLVYLKYTLEIRVPHQPNTRRMEPVIEESRDEDAWLGISSANYTKVTRTDL